MNPVKNQFQRGYHAFYIWTFSLGFLNVGNLKMWKLTAIATAIIIICVGITSCAGKSRFSIKTVENPIVAHSRAKAVILVFLVNPLPSV